VVQWLSVDPLLALSFVTSGVVAGWASVLIYRRYESDDDEVYEDLARPYLAVVLVFSLGMLLAPVFVAVVPSTIVGVLPFFVLLFMLPAWAVFVFRYAGRGHLVRRWWVAGGYALTTLIVATATVQLARSIEQGDTLFGIIAIIAALSSLFVLALYFVTVGVLALSTFRGDERSPVDAAVIVAPTAALLVLGQLTGVVDPAISRGAAVVLPLVAATMFPLSVTRYDVLSTRPGVSTLGEQAVVDTMEAAVLVVDREETVLRANAAARTAFEDPVGRSLEAVVGADAGSLRAAETVECWTTEGNRRLDPRITTVESDSGTHIGETVTLIDVTDREIRRQRIQVLNRILRHNLRNELSAIKARAELATDDDQPTDEHVASVLSIADDLQAMSADARRIQKRIADDGQSCVTVDTVVESVVTAVQESHRLFDVDVDVPAVTVTLDRGLLAYALRNLVENAVEHNDGDDPQVEVRGRETATGIELVVADNGPGIPDTEREVIEAGVEDAHTHTTSLGLWGTNWAVQTLGGTLTFGESGMGGTAVTLELPTDDSEGAA
jgi:signal transduction histidine kinase